MSFWDEIKELLYKPVKQDSRNFQKLGEKWNIPWLEQEGKKNVGNPGRAVGKAAANAAAWWLGSGLWGEGANAGATAAQAGAQTAAQGAMQGIGSATTEQLMQQAMQRAAIEAAQEGAKGGMFAVPGAAAAGGPTTGMFGMVPGVSNGSQQAAMLAAQNAGFGGEGANLTAQAAKDAAMQGYAQGKVGFMDHLGNIAKTDLAGMNDPKVWLARLQQNAGRLAGNAGKQMTQQALMGGQQQPSQPMAPPPRPQQQQQQPVDPFLMQQVEAELKAGRISFEEALRRLRGGVA